MFITKDLYNNEENQKDAAQLSWEIANALRSTEKSSRCNVSLAAYLLYRVSQDRHLLEMDLQDILNQTIKTHENIYYMAIEHFSDETWKRLLQFEKKYSPEQFALAALVNYVEKDVKETMYTPDSILKLVHKLLNVQPNDRVADICCGSGSYLVSAALEENRASYFGYELNAENSTIAQMRSELMDANIQVNLCDAFNLVMKDNSGEKFDKIFSNYPFGLRQKNLGAGADYVKQLSERYPGISKATSSDWVFNSLLCDLLTENGKAIGIMTNGSTWNSIDIPIRKYFVENRMIESVIALPDRMFVSTHIPTTLIVFSHNNDRVRMIDATNICHSGRRLNEFSDTDIANIIEALSVDSEYSKEISIEELRVNEYSLSLSRYVEEGLKFSNGVPFGNVIKRITRGASCTARQLDEMVSESVTNMQYLMLANIQDGIIDDKLPYLSSIDSKYEKYCLKNNSLILSKNGYPYKVAVASVKEGQRILANGNLYIIELDEEKANPYYIKAFFESEQGNAVLRSITVGGVIPNIGINKLQQVEIPIPSMAEQERIAQKYQATLDEISVLKLRLKKAINKLHHIVDEESE